MPLNVSREAKLYDVGLLPMVPTHPSSIVSAFPKFAVSGWLNHQSDDTIVHTCQMQTMDSKDHQVGDFSRLLINQC